MLLVQEIDPHTVNHDTEFHATFTGGLIHKQQTMIPSTMLLLQENDPHIVDHDTEYHATFLQEIDPQIVEHDSEYHATFTGDCSTNSRP